MHIKSSIVLTRYVMFLALLTLATTALRAEVVSLPKFNIKLNETSVSGLSSGGYMAVQFHVAYSSLVKGAGVIAGGPYFCAKDDQNIAISACSCTGFFACQPTQAGQMLPELIQLTNQGAGQGVIDATGNLSHSRVWLFSGTADSVVPPPVMKALDAYYKHYVDNANIFFEKSIHAEHAMPTNFFGNACGVKGDPYINNCHYDAAGELLKWIYGSLNAKNSGVLGGDFIEFDQGEFIAHPGSHGMWQTGRAYVPAACRQNALCRVHVVFHGCQQYPGASSASGPGGKMGDTYVRNSGYNQWADTNNIIVLYPQANAMTIGTRLLRTNPNGCWDWWGYDDGAYAQKSGRQMAAVRSMLDRLAGLTSPPPSPPSSSAFCGSATNTAHVNAGRAVNVFFWWYFARGSNDYLGWSGTATTMLKQIAPDSYQKVATCP